jgi:uncharacterized protein (TIGR02996 family)
MARHHELIAAIRANPHDVMAYRVYGEWLEQQGDPRGELIALHQMLDGNLHDDDLPRYIAGYLWRHRSLVPAIEPWRVHYDWRWGFIIGATIDRPTVTEINVLLAHPSCVLLEHVSANGADAAVHRRLEHLRTRLEVAEFHPGWV